MKRLAVRLARVEEQLQGHGIGRVIAVRSSGASDEAIQRLLDSVGVYTGPRDRIAHIRLFGIEAEPELLNITPMKRRFGG